MQLSFDAISTPNIKSEPHGLTVTDGEVRVHDGHRHGPLFVGNSLRARVVNDSAEKKCDVCNLWKSHTDFYVDSRHVSDPGNKTYKGRTCRNRCKTCYQLKSLAWKSRRGTAAVNRKGVSVSYVYFIADGEFVKIGKANDVNQRKLSLETGNPRDLVTLGTISCDSESESYSLEKKLHRHFEPWHHRGEWFIIGPQILDFISAINPTQPTNEN